MKTITVRIKLNGTERGFDNWFKVACLRSSKKINGNVYFLFDDLFEALNGNRDPKFFIEYAKKFFNSHH